MTALPTHHGRRSAMVRIARPGVTTRWEVRRPVRWSWWAQLKRQRACRKAVEHCWHPEGMVDWWCCECAAETGGMPPERCKLCRAER